MPHVFLHTSSSAVGAWQQSSDRVGKKRTHDGILVQSLSSGERGRQGGMKGGGFRSGVRLDKVEAGVKRAREEEPETNPLFIC